MIRITKSTVNMVDKRIIYLKNFPENADIYNDPALKRKWAALKYVQYDRVGTQIIISREQAEQSTVLAVSRVINTLGWNIDKVEYFLDIDNKKTKVTMWEECVQRKKTGYPSRLKSVVIIENICSGKKLISYSGEEDDNTYDTVNEEMFPSNCIVSYGSIALDYLDAFGKLPPSDELQFKEIDFDAAKITEQRKRKPEIVFTNEIRITRDNYDTVYIPITGSDMELYDAESRVRQFLMFDETSHLDTVNLMNDDAAVLTIAKDHTLYSIGIIDESNGKIYYLNNNKKHKKESFTELCGETYPDYMITNDRELVLSVLKYFIKYGKPYDKVSWITQLL